MCRFCRQQVTIWFVYYRDCGIVFEHMAGSLTASVLRLGQQCCTQCTQWPLGDKPGGRADTSLDGGNFCWSFMRQGRILACPAYVFRLMMVIIVPAAQTETVSSQVADNDHSSSILCSPHTHPGTYHYIPQRISPLRAPPSSHGPTPSPHYPPSLTTATVFNMIHSGGQKVYLLK